MPDATTPICLMRKLTIVFARSGRDEWRKLEHERQRKREETKKRKTLSARPQRVSEGKRGLR